MAAVAAWDAEPAGAWFRVSTATQDEENQEPEVMAYIHSCGYKPQKVYRVKASARKRNKRFDREWAQVLEDFRTGTIKVLVVWRLTRLDRKLEATQMIAEAVKAGGRIEFAKQPHLNNLSTMGGRISLTVEQEISFAESQEKSERIAAEFDKLRAKGSAIGKPPFGYVIKEVDGKKTFVSTALGRKWVPFIFNKTIEGWTLRQIAEALTAAGVSFSKKGTPVFEAVILRMIQRTTYMGVRPNAGILEFKPLISPTKWRQANAMLEKRARPGRGTTVTEKALVSGMCGNPDCKAGGVDDKGNRRLSPMHRSQGGKPWSKYRCYGLGARRNGCGTSLPETDIDSIVIDAMLADESLIPERVFIPGDNNADEIAKLQEKMTAAARQGDYKEVVRLSAIAEELSQQESRPSRWDISYTDKTVSSHFATLDLDGRREFLTDYQILICWDDIDSDNRLPVVTITHKSLLDSADLVQQESRVSNVAA